MTDVRMKGFRGRADLVSVQAWLDALPLARQTETVDLGEAAGRVLATSITSTVDVPAFRRSAMDGYALRGEDTFGASASHPLQVALIGEALPGQPFEGEVGAKQAVRIMTGAPVPPGADAVLRAEDAEEAGGQVRIREGVAPQKNVAKVGEDIRAGHEVLAAGRTLRPQDLGVAASIGLGELSVFRRPSVLLIVTGDELLPAGSAPEADRTIDSNSPMLRALVTRDGGDFRTTGILPDDPKVLRKHLEQAEVDLVLVSGGSSVGQEDHAPVLVAELGVLHHHGIAMRPASPSGIGQIGERLVFLLPGNPVSCLSAYDLLAGRVIRRLAGRSAEPPYRVLRRPLAGKISSALGRVDYVRVRIEGERVHPIAARGASLLSTTTVADGYVLVPKDSEGWPEDTPVDVWLYGP